MTDNVKSVLSSILEKFKDGFTIPKAIAMVQFPPNNIPCCKWSLLNRLIVLFSLSDDCRGFRQWQEAGRMINKGAKAVHILVPLIKKGKENPDKTIIAGFMPKPVFRIEDTTGRPIYHNMPTIPDLPLLERAKEWGISVKALPGNGKYHGYYCQTLSEIGLASPEECVFFHELIHCSDAKIMGKLKRGQDPIQEIVAELGALALCNIVGKDGNKHIGSSYQYIESYAEKLGVNPFNACVKVISRVEKALNLILKKEAYV